MQLHFGNGTEQLRTASSSSQAAQNKLHVSALVYDLINFAAKSIETQQKLKILESSISIVDLVPSWLNGLVMHFNANKQIYQNHVVYDKRSGSACDLFFEALLSLILPSLENTFKNGQNIVLQNPKTFMESLDIPEDIEGLPAQGLPSYIHDPNNCIILNVLIDYANNIFSTEDGSVSFQWYEHFPVNGYDKLFISEDYSLGEVVCKLRQTSYTGQCRRFVNVLFASNHNMNRTPGTPSFLQINIIDERLNKDQDENHVSFAQKDAYICDNVIYNDIRHVAQKLALGWFLDYIQNNSNLFVNPLSSQIKQYWDAIIDKDLNPAAIATVGKLGGGILCDLINDEETPSHDTEDNDITSDHEDTVMKEKVTEKNTPKTMMMPLQTQYLDTDDTMLSSEDRSSSFQEEDEKISAVSSSQVAVAASRMMLMQRRHIKQENSAISHPPTSAEDNEDVNLVELKSQDEAAHIEDKLKAQKDLIIQLFGELLESQLSESRKASTDVDYLTAFQKMELKPTAEGLVVGNDCALKMDALSAKMLRLCSSSKAGTSSLFTLEQCVFHDKLGSTTTAVQKMLKDMFSNKRRPSAKSVTEFVRTNLVFLNTFAASIIQSLNSLHQEYQFDVIVGEDVKTLPIIVHNNVVGGHDGGAKKEDRRFVFVYPQRGSWKLNLFSVYNQSLHDEEQVHRGDVGCYTRPSDSVNLAAAPIKDDAENAPVLFIFYN